MKTALFAILFPVALFAGISVEPGGPLFENDQVKVTRALEKAHVKGKPHEHKINRVMVYLQPGRQHFEYQDGRKAETFNWKAGQVVWSPADGVHAPEVTGNDPFNIVEVELKTAGGKLDSTSLDPLKVDPKHYSLEFENDQVRVLRVRLGAHETALMHEHAANRVTVFLTDQNIRATTPDGTVTTAQHKAGEALWGTPLKHKEENLSSQVFEVIMIEIKS